jgi:transposase InsO family protein
MPKTGTRKLMEHIENDLIKNNIKMGRDALFDLLRSYGLLVKKTKRFHITTDSKHFFFKSPNLLKELTLSHAEQVFVSDITYIKLDDNMKVSLVKEALAMAHKNCIHKHKSIIHHSDRGIQYCCPDFSEFAQNKGFILSTTQQYDPYENAVAERINGILKYEFGLKNTIKNIKIANKMTAEAVKIYNNERLHWSLELKTPKEVHRKYNQQPYKSYARKVA